jgi:hypothetical protein
VAGLRGRLVGRILLRFAVSACVAACGQGGPTASDAVNNYMYALAEGNYAGACKLLAPGAREALKRSHGRRTSCEKLIARCLPNQVTRASHDQSQLLYATVLLTHDRGVMRASVSGTAAARATRQVTVAQRRGQWELTSPGGAISRCRLAGRHHRRGSAKRKV